VISSSGRPVAPAKMVRVTGTGRWCPPVRAARPGRCTGARFVTSCTENCAPAGRRRAGPRRRGSRRATPARLPRASPARCGIAMGVPGDPAAGTRRLRRLLRHPASRVRSRRAQPRPSAARKGVRALRRASLALAMTAQTLSGRMPSGLHSWIAVQTPCSRSPSRCTCAAPPVPCRRRGNGRLGDDLVVLLEGEALVGRARATLTPTKETTARTASGNDVSSHGNSWVRLVLHVALVAERAWNGRRSWRSGHSTPAGSRRRCAAGLGGGDAGVGPHRVPVASPTVTNELPTP